VTYRPSYQLIIVQKCGRRINNLGLIVKDGYIMNDVFGRMLQKDSHASIPASVSFGLLKDD
jgi:hypothetical protein